MPPFILIYMYMFELILISQLHPYEKYREKGKNTDWILKQLLKRKEKKCNRKKKKKKKERKGHLFPWSFWKISGLKIFLLQMWNSMSRISLLKQKCWANITCFCVFFSSFFTVRMKRSEYIYTTLTLHKYRNNDYCT